jgi:hypothetical protein
VEVTLRTRTSGLALMITVLKSTYAEPRVHAIAFGQRRKNPDSHAMASRFALITNGGRNLPPEPPSTARTTDQIYAWLRDWLIRNQPELGLNAAMVLAPGATHGTVGSSSASHAQVAHNTEAEDSSEEESSEEESSEEEESSDDEFNKAVCTESTTICRYRSCTHLTCNLVCSAPGERSYGDWSRLRERAMEPTAPDSLCSHSLASAAPCK